MKHLIALTAAAFLWAGCRHAQSVDTPGDERPEEAQAQPATGGSGGTHKAEKRKDARPPPEPGRPPLATSPAGLLLPGAVVKIQQALANRGFLNGHESGELDEPTSAALRRFQEKEDLARTGAPDRETLRKLGLDPQRVFRTTEDAAAAH